MKVAVQGGHLECVQLLAACGTSLTAKTSISLTALDFAKRGGDRLMMGWLNLVGWWPPLKTAVAYWLHVEALLAPALGHIDTAGCTRKSLVAVASHDSMWPGSLSFCPMTLGLARKVLLPWSPATHRSYHWKGREAVRVVLHVAARRDALPVAAWELVCSFLRRDDWEAATV